MAAHSIGNEAFAAGLQGGSVSPPIHGWGECSDGSPCVSRETSETSRRERRDQRILENMHLARIIAIRIYEGLPLHIELEELIQVGVLGLIDAADRYDESRSVSFASYAKHRIRGAILDTLRDMDWASRDQRRRCKQLETVVRDLSGTLHRTPTESEIAELMGIELTRWQKMVSQLQTQVTVSASSRTATQNELPDPEFPADETENPDRICQRHELAEALRGAVMTLPYRYQSVVRMYYTEDMTMKEIGYVLGVNESRISQIHKSALRKMATVLESAGISAAAAL